MSDDQVVYRVPIVMVLAVVGPLVVVGALLLFALSLSDASAGVLVGVGVGYLVFGLFMLALAVRPMTVVSGTGIRVRRAFGGSFHPWATIVDIQVEEVSGQSAARLQVYGAVLHDADQRRVPLPYLHHRRLGSERLEAEVNELRRRWRANLN